LHHAVTYFLAKNYKNPRSFEAAGIILGKFEAIASNDLGSLQNFASK